MEDNKERIALKLIQISDLHITEHRDLLSPMIDAINKEVVDYNKSSSGSLKSMCKSCQKIINAEYYKRKSS